MSASRRSMLYIPNEGQLQNQIVEGLERLGYHVLQTGRWMRQTQCPKCSTFHVPRTGFGNTRGCPDLFVTHPRWKYPYSVFSEHDSEKRAYRGSPVWLGMEIKTPSVKTLLGPIPGGRLRKEQQALADLGLIVVVRSWDEALAAVRAMEVGV